MTKQQRHNPRECWCGINHGYTQPATLYCECETPIIDVGHDAGCRRCGLPVDFSPRPPELEAGELLEEV